MGMNLNLSASASGTRNVGQGGGANLRQQNIFGAPTSVLPASYYTPGNGSPAISTSDYYHTDGLYWFRCYDLNQFGATGISIGASRGRYFWIASADHPSTNYGWRDGKDFRGGFSSRLGVLPATMDLLFRDVQSNIITRGGTEQWGVYHTPYLVYNPDDATYPFYMYCEGLVLGGTAVSPHTQATQHEEGLFRSTDLTTWINNGPSHFNEEFLDWSSFQRVFRNGFGDWYSVGLSTSGHNYGGPGKWTSTDALTFTQVSTGLTDTFSSRSFVIGASDEVTITAQKWIYAREDARSADGGMYVTRVALDSNYNVLSSPAPVRISAKYLGDYPGPTYMNDVSAYVESGVAHIFCSHGMFALEAGAGAQGNLPYIGNSNTGPYNGSGTLGPLRQQNIDYYTEIVDAAAAAQSSPVGLQASCASGVVTLTWMDVLPNQTYRVYRGTTAGTQATLVGDVAGVTTTNSPTADVQYWYKVVTLESGTERSHSVVSVYCSANSALTNKHIDRVLLDGADASTIDATWIESAVSWLSGQSLTSSLMYWVNPAFGTKKSGSTVQKIYCLGTTQLPRGGDYTPSTSNTTYSATGMNGTVPGWTNPGTSDRGYFGNGRINNIRRKVQITCVAAYKKPNTNTATLIAMNEFSSGMVLQHTSGTPGNASFLLKPSGSAVTATKATSSATAANIIAGVFDGAELTVYVEAVAGTAQTGLEANSDLALTTALKGKQASDATIPFLGSGSENSKYTVNTETYSFSDAQAQFSASDMIVLEKGLTSSQVTSLTSLLRTRIGA